MTRFLALAFQVKKKYLSLIRISRQPKKVLIITQLKIYLSGYLDIHLLYIIPNTLNEIP